MFNRDVASEAYGLGSAQSVHSRATQKVPCSRPRRMRVSTPDRRRFFNTGKLWPRSGWKGCRISAQPKGALLSCAVRADCPDNPRSGGANGGSVGSRTDFRGRPPAGTIRLSGRPQRVGRSATRPQADQYRTWTDRGCGSQQLLGFIYTMPPYS